MVNTTPRVILTGASQGIGRAIFLELARGGHFVLGVSRTKPEGIPEFAPSSESVYIEWKRLDLSDAADVEQCASSLEAMAIRALVLSAVDYGPGGRHPASETAAEEWQRVIATNCIGQCVLVSRLLPRLIANAPGIIVNVSSDIAILPGAGRSAYAASKAGLHAMLRAVAAENPGGRLCVYQLIPTFQMVTNGIRKRRPAGFDFSGYADPALLAQVVCRIVSSSGNSLAPGTYLVRRDGTLDPYQEATSI
jgi:NAD(P)-dependent dehydrogenase (short-subunit alcohol dehydrogenase family)